MMAELFGSVGQARAISSSRLKRDELPCLVLKIIFALDQWDEMSSSLR